ncbi:MAG: hypothetical protein ACPG4T_12390, partial [Nannocystaceae bacterium]
MRKFFKVGVGAVLLSKVEWFRADGDSHVQIGIDGKGQYFQCLDAKRLCGDLMTALTTLDTEENEDPWEET